MQAIKFFSLIIACFYSVTTYAHFQYIDETGLVQGVAADIIKTLNINLDLYKNQKQLPTNHIFNTYNFLKLFYQDGNYQNRQEFYRKGGKPDYHLSQEQALQILRIYRGRFAFYQHDDPQVRKKAATVICAGVDWSLDKRIFSFKKFLEVGFACDQVFFLSRTVDLNNNVHRAIQRHHSLFINKQLHPLYIPYHGSSTHEDFIITLKSLNIKEFYLISDPEYADILLESFTSYGMQHGVTCLGVFVRPITSSPDEYLELDLKSYKFDEYISTREGQLQAAAYASLGQLGHQVFHEIKLRFPNFNA